MSVREEREIRSVAVLGGGLVGLSAALAFARALPRVAVTLVETLPDPAALADRLPGSLPTVHRFHAAIGLNEIELIRRDVAFHHLGTRFKSWSASGEDWYHVFGAYGLPAGVAPFHQVWARARRTGEAQAFHRYSAAAAMAEAGKFVHPTPDETSPLSAHLYGLRFDPDRYRQQLQAAAEALPIRRLQASLEGAERRDDGGVGAVLLGGGESLEADLFLDCSGPSAPLLATVDSRFEEWGNYLPGDRLSLAWGTAENANATCDSATAEPFGWRLAAPVPGRVMTALVSNSEGGGVHGELVAIRPGRRPEPWVRNVLALGDASVALDPLQSTNLHLAQSAIFRALELLPGRDCHPLELREYNRRTGQETTRVRDFLALHYLRSGRSEGAFWRGLESRDLPDTLAHTLEQFEARGRLPFYEEESFEKESWLAVLFGLGVVPRATDPAAAAVGAAESAAAMAAYADKIAAIPARLPNYRDYVARMKRARPGG